MNIPFKLKCSVGTLLFAATPALMAQVQSASMTDPAGHVVVSTGFADKGYDVDRASSATRTSARLIETPASVEVVDQELIRDKAILNPGELANVVSGVQSNSSPFGTGSSTNDFIIRGFSTNGINYRDGFRVNGINAPSDMANVERVEFVKGPGSVLYGAAQPGGSVNTITKKALDYNYAYADVQAGSWDFLRSTFDVNQVFGDFSARLNVAGDKGNSYVDMQSSNNYMIAPTLKWRINGDTELSYSGEFQKTNTNGGYTGLPALQGVQNLNAGTNMGQKWTRQSNTANTNQVDFKYKIDSEWTFRQGVLSANYSANYSPGITGSMLLGTGSMSGAYVDAFNSSSEIKNTSSQTELYGDVKTGELAHKLMFGYEYTQTKYNWANAVSASWIDNNQSVNLNNPQYIPNPNDYGAYSPTAAFYGLQTSWLDNKTQKSNALYFQDQISWGGWRLLAGLRNERVNTLADYYGYSQTEAATTGRAGLLYMIAPETSIYYSISQSFTPNGSYRGVGGSILPSSRGLQNEVGLKHSVWKGLDATASLFQITKSNVPAYVSTGVYTVNGGEQSKGWEASLVGQATKSLRMIANATGLNATVTSATRNSLGTAPAGSQLYGVPKFSANIWGVQDLSMDVPGKVSAGVGVVYVGDRNATTPNTAGLVLPSYTSVDAGLFYKIDRLNLALNVKNLTNATVLNASQNVFVSRQPGISYLATAGINF
jgi:iron complex outermembrane receptor protein